MDAVRLSVCPEPTVLGCVQEESRIVTTAGLLALLFGVPR